MTTVLLTDFLMTLDKEELIEWIIGNYLWEANEYWGEARNEYQMLVNGKERIEKDGYYDNGNGLVYYRSFNDLLDREFGLDTDLLEPTANEIPGYMNGYEWRWHYDGYRVIADDSKMLRSWRFTEETHDENDFWIIEADHPVMGRHYRIATNQEHQHFSKGE